MWWLIWLTCNRPINMTWTDVCGPALRNISAQVFRNPMRWNIGLERTYTLHIWVDLKFGQQQAMMNVHTNNYSRGALRVDLIWNGISCRSMYSNWMDAQQHILLLAALCFRSHVDKTNMTPIATSLESSLESRINWPITIIHYDDGLGLWKCGIGNNATLPCNKYAVLYVRRLHYIRVCCDHKLPRYASALIPLTQTTHLQLLHPLHCATMCMTRQLTRSSTKRPSPGRTKQ